MKVLFLLGLSFALAQANADDEWTAYKKKFGKVYDTEGEEPYRRSVFLANKMKIMKHNAKYARGEATYYMSLNHLSDLTLDEVRHIYHGHKSEGSIPGLLYKKSNEILPDTVDWRKKGAVTPIKNQGGCGSCWAFSATGTLEGQLFLKTGQLISLSEQQLVDCSNSDIFRNDGCASGNVYNSFRYIYINNGLDTEEAYPYKGQNHSCEFKHANVGVTIKGYENIPKGDESALKDAVAKVGPISVTIDADHDSFKHYGGGIHYEPACKFNTSSLHHSVLVVGYGTENGQDYWLIKNSWGPTWGEEGYGKMTRNANNLCGIAEVALYPLV